MIEELVKEIERIRTVLNSDTDTYRRGRGAERNVLEHLVRPILFKLGWDPRSIRTEYPVYVDESSENYVDFALFHEDSPVLAVEGKKLDSDVGQDSLSTRQLTRYLIAMDCHFGITTNGTIWNLWKRSGYRTELAWSLDIMNRDPAQCASVLKDLARDAISDLKASIELREVRAATLISAWEDVLSDRGLQLEAMAWILKKQTDAADEGLGIELNSAKEYIDGLYENSPELFPAPTGTVVDSFEEEEGPSPQETAIRKPVPKSLVIEGERIPISDVLEILTRTAEWLIEKGDFGKNDCPVQVTSGKGAFRYLVNTRPVHANGTAFTRPRMIQGGLFMETHYGRVQAEYYARKLLRKFRPSGQLHTEA